jgi:hypothetical protein
MLGQWAIAAKFVQDRPADPQIRKRLELGVAGRVELACGFDQPENPSRLQVLHIDPGREATHQPADHMLDQWQMGDDQLVPSLLVGLSLIRLDAAGHDVTRANRRGSTPGRFKQGSYGRLTDTGQVFRADNGPPVPSEGRSGFPGTPPRTGRERTGERVVQSPAEARIAQQGDLVTAGRSPFASRQRGESSAPPAGLGRGPSGGSGRHGENRPPGEGRERWPGPAQSGHGTDRPPLGRCPTRTRSVRSPTSLIVGAWVARLSRIRPRFVIGTRSPSKRVSTRCRAPIVITFGMSSSTTAGAVSPDLVDHRLQVFPAE